MAIDAYKHSSNSEPKQAKTIAQFQRFGAPSQAITNATVPGRGQRLVSGLTTRGSAVVPVQGHRLTALSQTIKAGKIPVAGYRFTALAALIKTGQVPVQGLRPFNVVGSSSASRPTSGQLYPRGIR